MWAFSTACFARKNFRPTKETKRKLRSHAVARTRTRPSTGGGAHLLAPSDFPWKNSAQTDEFRVVMDAPPPRKLRPLLVF